MGAEGVSRGRGGQETLGAVVEGEERLVGTGEVLCVKPGQLHTFSNADPAHPLILRITIEPALHFQWFMTEVARSALRGGGRWKDASLLELGWILNQVTDEHDLPGLPRFAKRPLFGTLAPLAVVTRRAGRIEPRLPHGG